MNKIFFTSDIHFSHRSLIEKHKLRPFDSIDEMNATIIEKWNIEISPKDEVYILGDFAMCSWKKAVDFVKRLNGRKYLIAGNHDKSLIHKKEFYSQFEWIKDLYTLKVVDPDAPFGKQRIVLCHYAMLIWDQAHYGAWHLHGHSHGNLDDDFSVKRMDVGMDSHEYVPIDYATVKQHMSKRGDWKPLDHHVPPVATS